MVPWNARTDDVCRPANLNVLPPLGHQARPPASPEIAALLVLLFLAGVAGYLFLRAQRHPVAARECRGNHRFDLLAAAIGSEVTRVTIPGMLALHADVLDLLRSGDGVPRSARQQAVNHLPRTAPAPSVDNTARLRRWIAAPPRRGVERLDTDRQPARRRSRAVPYSRRRSRAPYRQYAVDGVRDEPGFFFAQTIRDERQDWKIISVAVMKAEHPAPSSGNGWPTRRRR